MYLHCYSNGHHLMEYNDQQYFFVQTIAGNMEGYFARQINDVRRALKLVQILGHTSQQDDLDKVRGGMMKNRDVTEDDVKRMYYYSIIYVPPMKVKMTGKLLIDLDLVLIPQAVCLCIYIIFLRSNKSYYP